MVSWSTPSCLASRRHIISKLFDLVKLKAAIIMYKANKNVKISKLFDLVKLKAAIIMYKANKNVVTK